MVRGVEWAGHFSLCMLYDGMLCHLSVVYLLELRPPHELVHNFNALCRCTGQMDNRVMSEIAPTKNCFFNLKHSIIFKLAPRLKANRDRNYQGTKQP